MTRTAGRHRVPPRVEWAVGVPGVADPDQPGPRSDRHGRPADPPDPYDFLPQVPSFTVTSTDFADGAPLPTPHVSGLMGAGGEDRSPQLSWSGFPEGTQSFAVTVYDPDAPTASGFWHWAVADIPASVTELPAAPATGAAAARGRVQLRNDGGFAGLRRRRAPVRARHPPLLPRRPRASTPTTLGVAADATPAVLGFNLFFHTLARATLVVDLRGELTSSPASDARASRRRSCPAGRTRPARRPGPRRRRRRPGTPGPRSPGRARPAPR